MGNLVLSPDQRKAREHAKRDAVLNALQKTRVDLIAVGTRIAKDLVKANGHVTSVQVFDEMRMRGYGTALKAVDPRFMGAVFRSGNGWKREGYDTTGSHGRPVAVWVRGEGS